MPNYKEMYYTLFNKVSDVIVDLQEIQILTEQMYIESDEKIIDMNLIENDKENIVIPRSDTPENIKNNKIFDDSDK